jgi:O-antigen/teichoic acid export membrane protein
MSAPQGPGEKRDWRGESQATRDDRNLAELLQELRVAGLGVQVLFGFLLSLPFTARFERLGDAQRDLYVVAVVLAAAAIVLLVGPVAYHRVVFRRHQKEHLVRAANRMAIYGLAAVALAISAAVLLVMSYLVPGIAAALITAFVIVLFAGLWLALPLVRRGRGEPGDDIERNDRPRQLSTALPTLLPASGTLVARVSHDRSDRRHQANANRDDDGGRHRVQPHHRPGENDDNDATAHQDEVGPVPVHGTCHG